MKFQTSKDGGHTDNSISFLYILGLKGYDTCGPSGTVISTALDAIYQHKYGEERGHKLIGEINLDSAQFYLLLWHNFARTCQRRFNIVIKYVTYV